MRILMRGHKDPFRAVSAFQAWTKNLIGNNVGNLLFAQSTYRLLSTSGTQITVRSLRGLDPADVNDRYDQVVIPLANAFRPSFAEELADMTRLITKLTIPVVVTSVGWQAPFHGRVVPSSLDPTVKEFVGAVLDHSTSLGVRGEMTANYLASLGFGSDVVEVVGCPSLFMRGPDLAIRKAPELDSHSAISMNICPSLSAMVPVSLDHAARYPNLMYTAQDQLTLGLMLTGQFRSKVPYPQNGPITLGHPLLKENRTRFCLDPSTWMSYLRGFEFSFGTRIHGNIAALLAGVPAVVLAYDSRTLELCMYHQIPWKRLKSEGIDAIGLCAGADWGPMMSGHAERWERMSQFLAHNGLRHVYLPGESPGRFDRRLEAVHFPTPVDVRSLRAVNRYVARIAEPLVRRFTSTSWPGLTDWVN